jgi:hypothetical protein
MSIGRMPLSEDTLVCSCNDFGEKSVIDLKKHDWLGLGTSMLNTFENATRCTPHFHSKAYHQTHVHNVESKTHTHTTVEPKKKTPKNIFNSLWKT